MDESGLLQRVKQGDQQARDELFVRHRDRLLRMVRLRLDQRLHGRIDASDVIQDTHLEALQRLDEYLRDPKMPFDPKNDPPHHCGRAANGVAHLCSQEAARRR